MNSRIGFHLECNVDHPFIDQEVKLQEWLYSVAKSEDKHIIQLNFIFCDDNYLLDINKKYLNHDYFTDIITFPYQEGDLLEGDMFISLDRIRENAGIYGTGFLNELQRVMVHGLLHLMGYPDTTEEEKKKMTDKENFYLMLI